jgi:hypothetical protein
MPDVTIDLKEQIKKLRERWEELDELWVNPPGPSAGDKTDQRERIELWLRRINEKILSLSRIKVNKEAAQVIVRCPTDAEKKQIQDAMADLSKVLQREQAFTELFTTVTTILNSANTVINAAKGGEAP